MLLISKPESRRLKIACYLDRRLDTIALSPSVMGVFATRLIQGNATEQRRCTERMLVFSPTNSKLPRVINVKTRFQLFRFGPGISR